MPKRKGEGEGGNPSLANEEQSLKEKYALMRAKKVPSITARTQHNETRARNANHANTTQAQAIQ
jgi:hypothetical protein